MIRNNDTSYGLVAKIFHWVIFVLLFCMIVFGYFLDDISKDYQGMAYNLHKLTGLTILLLMLLRACWAIVNINPRLLASTPLWQRYAERVVHSLLYISVIIMPLAGWIGSCAAGRAPHLNGWVLSLPVPQDDALKDVAFDVHGVVAVIIIVLVGIHVAAALYHQFIKRDNILSRML